MSYMLVCHNVAHNQKLEQPATFGSYTLELGLMYPQFGQILLIWATFRPNNQGRVAGRVFLEPTVPATVACLGKPNPSRDT